MKQFRLQIFAGLLVVVMLSCSSALGWVMKPTRGGGTISPNTNTNGPGGMPEEPIEWLNLTASPTNKTRQGSHNWGCEFVSSTNPILIYGLGRYVYSGSTDIHPLYLCTSNGASTIATLNLQTAGLPEGMAYTNFDTPIQLAANTSYTLTSWENASGGDYFANEFSTFWVDNVASITAAAASGYGTPGCPDEFFASTNQMYAGVSFLYGHVPAPPVTNDWMGTWIRGLPLVDANTNVAYATPAVWTIMCASNNYSQHTHMKLHWYSWTKVCPGDVVYVLWPPWATNSSVPNQNSFVIVQRGTNDVGANFTNSYVGTIDLSQGCMAGWTVPAWPTVWSHAFMEAECWPFITPTNCCPAMGGTNSEPDENWCIPNPGFFPPGDGPFQFPSDDGGWGNPGPTIDPPDKGDLCPVPYFPDGEIIPIFNNPMAAPSPLQQCLPEYPPVLPPGTNNPSTNGFRPRVPYVHAVRLSDAGVQDSTNTVELATNTILFLPFLVHGIPGTTYEIQSSTNLINWAREGNTNFAVDSNGLARAVLWSTNYLDFQEPTRHYRLHQQ